MPVSGAPKTYSLSFKEPLNKYHFFVNSSFRRKPESGQNNCLLDAGLHRHDGKVTFAEFP